MTTRLRAVHRGVRDERAFVACLVGTWLLTAATHYYIIAPASVLSTVATDLRVTPARAVWLVSAVPASWAVTNFALGVWIDRLGDYTMIAIGTGIVVIAGGWSWWAGHEGAFWSLLTARLVAGVAVGVIWTASTNLVGGAVSDANRGTAIGVFITSAPAGFAMGQLSGPLVAARFGWHANFLAMILGPVVAFALLTAGVRGLTVEPTTNTASMRANFAAILRRPVVWYGCAMAFAAYSCYLFLNSWLPSYLAREFALSAALSGLLTAVFPAMGVLSRAGGGAISDRLLNRRRLPVLRVAFLVSLPLVVLIALTDVLAVIVAALVVAGFVVQLTFGVVYSYVQEVVEPQITGTALSFLTTAGISGAFTAPLVAGALIEITETYLLAFAYAAALTGLGLLVSWFAPESRGPSES
ncbi:MFS transporter (plasmid) [Halorussus limi]|uniref:MFS transporter n=1 Tax=Halorussus limi TaxID=2938695 RepID=A0A8U0I0L3_9EURY|nr:MFS transporter [Halorussus limi]UPV76727.1 MFS transporter [Halorussus limi]